MPTRTCVGCRKVRPKRELVRITHTQGGYIEIDPEGERPGRGAYLCKSQVCWETALKNEQLARALRTRIDEETREELARYRETLAARVD